jgi:hypothetical protein
MLTILLLTTAAGGLIGTASGLTAFAVTSSDKVAQTQLPPAIQQQLDQLSAKISGSADRAAAQVEQTTPEERTAQARQVGERAAKGGAIGAAAAAVALILGALAAAFGGSAGQRYPFRERYITERHAPAA